LALHPPAISTWPSAGPGLEARKSAHHRRQPNAFDVLQELRQIGLMLGKTCCDPRIDVMNVVLQIVHQLNDSRLHISVRGVLALTFTDLQAHMLPPASHQRMQTLLCFICHRFGETMLGASRTESGRAHCAIGAAVQWRGAGSGRGPGGLIAAVSDLAATSRLATGQVVRLNYELSPRDFRFITHRSRRESRAVAAFVQSHDPLEHSLRP